MSGLLPFLILAALVILTFVSALLSALETAVQSIRPFSLQSLRPHHPQVVERLGRLLAQPGRLVESLGIADSAVDLPLMLLALYAADTLTPSPMPVLLSVALLAGLVIVVAEILPKIAGTAWPLLFCQRGILVLETVSRVVEPVRRSLAAGSDRIATLLLPRSFKRRPPIEGEEFRTLLGQFEEEQSLEEAETDILRAVLRLGERSVKDCMTPRVDMIALPDDLDNAEVLRRVLQRNFRRIPVYAETPDNVVGILDVKTLLASPEEPYAEQLLPPSYVPETMRALDLLRAFRTHAQGMAVIVDEFGGTEGIITASDLVDELLGEAAPAGAPSLYIEELEPGTFLVSGNARLDDIGEHIGAQLEADGVDTIGGLVFNRLGVLPRPGAQLSLQGLDIEVRRVSRRRIEELTLRLADPKQGEADSP